MSALRIGCGSGREALRWVVPFLSFEKAEEKSVHSIVLMSMIKDI